MTTEWEEPELDLFGEGTKPVHYNPPTDELGRRLVHVMWDERWHTLAELAERVAGGYGEATISARLRRFPPENGLDYTKRPIGDGAKWEYRLVLPW